MKHTHSLTHTIQMKRSGRENEWKYIEFRLRDGTRVVGGGWMGEDKLGGGTWNVGKGKVEGMSGEGLSGGKEG